MGLPAESLTDETLLRGLAGNQPDVALAFVRRFQSHIYGVALAVVGDQGLAEEVAQQTFERAWRRAPTFDPERGSPRAWLTAIARNLAVDALRARRPQPVDPIDLVRLLAPAAEGPEESSVRNDARARLQAAIRCLPADQARALVMAGVYRMTAQEVADWEDVPLGTAKSRIRSAMIKLRHQLAPEEEMSNE